MTTDIPNIIRKVRKLAVLAERGVGGERETAERLYHELLDRYDLDPDSFEVEHEHHLECPRTHSRIAGSIANHLGLTAFQGQGRVLFMCSDAAFDLVRSLYAHSVELIALHRRELSDQVKDDLKDAIAILEERSWGGDVGGLVRRRQFRCPRGLMAFVRALAGYVGARLPRSRATKSVVVIASDTQYAALRAHYGPVAMRITERFRGIPHEVDGFIAGHLDAAYPADIGRMPCAQCEERSLAVSPLGRVYCTRCGYRYNAPHRRTVDGRGYAGGVRRSKRALCAPVATAD